MVIDELLEELSAMRLGGSIGNKIFPVLAFTDDLVLISNNNVGMLFDLRSHTR